MDYKFIQNISLSEDLATINIYDEIRLMDGEFISSELRYLSTQVNNIDIRINSIGGNVIASFGIFSTIRDLVSKGVNITTYNDGIAFSCAGWLLQAGKVRKAADFSLFMLHNPYNTNDGGSIEVLNLFKNSIVKILSESSNLSEEEISAMMNKDGGEGTFLDSADMLENGFVDEIFNTNFDKEITNLLNKNTPINEVLNVVNSIYKHPTKKEDMSKLNSLLGLKNEASEAAQISAIQDLTNKAAQNAQLKTELEEKTSKLEELQNKLKLEQEQKAEALISNAISEGKLEESSREIWLNMAKNDFETTETALAGIVISKNTFTDATTIPAKREEALSGIAKEMTEAKEYANLFKNDGGALLAMQQNDNEKYLRLRNAYTKAINNGHKF